MQARRLKALDYATPTRSVGKGTMYENNVSGFEFRGHHHLSPFLPALSEQPTQK
jgi:hypothetical protein